MTQILVLGLCSTRRHAMILLLKERVEKKNRDLLDYFLNTFGFILYSVLLCIFLKYIVKLSPLLVVFLVRVST